MPNWLIYIISVIGFIYLLNPTFGVLEIIPDNIPIVGNLDEGAAALLVWQGISRWMSNRKKRQ
ncbi:MAG: DUF1232 domain-containing protein [Chloroflexi bacterium]|nr:DUF1232 domain-containing protein [Chloroflexota bacterium]